jgi:hypothetical protein
MSRPVRRVTDLPRAALDIGRAKELLLHPCTCTPDRPHSLGEHLWRSTRDMAPGVIAHATDAIRIGPANDSDLDGDQPDPPGDATVWLHPEFRRRVSHAWTACLDLVDFVQAHRPDREALGDEEVATDEDWCRSCLRIGVCSPRSRGDLCDFCYRFSQVVAGMHPPEWLILARHEGRRVTEQMMTDAIREVRPARKKKRRKAG